MTKAEALTTLGEHVASLRRRRGLTQEEIAERMDVSRNHVSDIELGARNVGIWSYLRLARALDVSAAELFSPFGGAAHFLADR
jgi:transcriptional regulator with XRE-family HTH domain